MDISDKIYDILVREVDRLDIKQRDTGLSRDDVAILSTLTSTAVSIKRATPEKKDPVEDLAYEQLMSMALAPLREAEQDNERTKTAGHQPETATAEERQRTPKQGDEAGDTGTTETASQVDSGHPRPRRGYEKGATK